MRRETMKARVDIEEEIRCGLSGRLPRHRAEQLVMAFADAVMSGALIPTYDARGGLTGFDRTDPNGDVRGLLPKCD